MEVTRIVQENCLQDGRNMKWAPCKTHPALFILQPDEHGRHLHTRTHHLFLYTHTYFIPLTHFLITLLSLCISLTYICSLSNTHTYTHHRITLYTLNTVLKPLAICPFCLFLGPEFTLSSCQRLSFISLESPWIPLTSRPLCNSNWNLP